MCIIYPTQREISHAAWNSVFLSKGCVASWNSCACTSVYVRVRLHGLAIQINDPPPPPLWSQHASADWLGKSWGTSYKHEEQKQQSKWMSEVKTRERREGISLQCLEVFRGGREGVWVCGCVLEGLSGRACVCTDITACYCFVRVPDWGSCFTTQSSPPLSVFSVCFLYSFKLYLWHLIIQKVPNETAYLTHLRLRTMKSNFNFYL